jgi:hypothetical protein
MIEAVGIEHLEVAVAFLPLIDKVVEDADARMAAIDDVVLRWRRLTPADQQQYEEHRGRPGFRPIMAFAEEFFHAMDDEATAELAGMIEGTVAKHPVDGQPYEPLEAARINHWRDHLAHALDESDGTS